MLVFNYIILIASTIGINRFGNKHTDPVNTEFYPLSRKTWVSGETAGWAGLAAGVQLPWG